MDIWRFKIRAGCDSVHWRAAQDEKEVPSRTQSRFKLPREGRSGEMETAKQYGYEWNIKYGTVIYSPGEGDT